MEFERKKNAGLSILTCIVISVTVVYGQNVCYTMPFGDISATLSEVNTTVHVPIFNKIARSTAQCLEVCSRVALCNFINFETTTHECLLFDMESVDPIENTAAETWLAMHYQQWTTPRYGCISNNCEAGKQCFDMGTGPICAPMFT